MRSFFFLKYVKSTSNLALEYLFDKLYEYNLIYYNKYFNIKLTIRINLSIYHNHNQ